jgi:hypothetical protein
LRFWNTEVLQNTKTVQEAIRAALDDGQQPAPGVGLEAGCREFFPSIHKATLYEILARWINDPEVRWLTQTLLFHDPTTHYCFQSRN